MTIFLKNLEYTGYQKVFLNDLTPMFDFKQNNIELDAVDLKVVESISNLTVDEFEAKWMDEKWQSQVFDGWMIKALNGEMDWVHNSMKMVKQNTQDLLIYCIDKEKWNGLKILLEKKLCHVEACGFWPFRYSVTWNKSKALPILLPYCDIHKCLEFLTTTYPYTESILREKGYDAAHLFGLLLPMEQAQKWLSIIGEENGSPILKKILSQKISSSPNVQKSHKKQI